MGELSALVSPVRSIRKVKARTSLASSKLFNGISLVLVVSRFSRLPRGGGFDLARRWGRQHTYVGVVINLE